MALPAIDPTTAPTAMEPMVPIIPEPAAAGAAAGAVAAGLAIGAGAAATGALAGAGADMRGAAFMPPPMRLAWASEGSVREASARATMERPVRKEAFMKSVIQIKAKCKCQGQVPGISRCVRVIRMQRSRLLYRANGVLGPKGLANRRVSFQIRAANQVDAVRHRSKNSGHF